MRLALAVALAIALPGRAADHTVRLSSSMYFLPPVKAVVITKAGDPGPGQAKHEAIATAPKLGDEVKLTGDGPFDLWFVPKDGKPVKAVAGWKPADGPNEVKLNDHLGVIQFRGDGQPRGTLLVTPYYDPGPEAKGHTVVQTASGTRAELAVPPGDYAIWLVPESGARPRRVVDKVRVHAGKTASAD
jgi:hypothetical protein